MQSRDTTRRFVLEYPIHPDSILGNTHWVHVKKLADFKGERDDFNYAACESDLADANPIITLSIEGLKIFAVDSHADCIQSSQNTNPMKRRLSLPGTRKRRHNEPKYQTVQMVFIHYWNKF